MFQGHVEIFRCSGATARGVYIYHYSLEEAAATSHLNQGQICWWLDLPSDDAVELQNGDARAIEKGDNARHDHALVVWLFFS